MDNINPTIHFKPIEKLEFENVSAVSLFFDEHTKYTEHEINKYVSLQQFI